MEQWQWNWTETNDRGGIVAYWNGTFLFSDSFPLTLLLFPSRHWLSQMVILPYFLALVGRSNEPT